MKPEISELGYISILYRLVIKFTNVRMIASVSFSFFQFVCACRYAACKLDSLRFLNCNIKKKFSILKFGTVCSDNYKLKNTGKCYNEFFQALSYIKWVLAGYNVHVN
jgi:hypothetical protein